MRSIAGVQHTANGSTGGDTTCYRLRQLTGFEQVNVLGSPYKCYGNSARERTLF